MMEAEFHKSDFYTTCYGCVGLQKKPMVSKLDEGDLNNIEYY